ncbi:MAG TPA: Crp/Fnr family transcriptional regulator [Cyclobacteriaceae bacterium]|nr:Crp/Fnr family transcriptional regulator [Cyclobacteriaceae bacterium]
MNEFTAYILQFGNLNKHQIDLIESKGTVVELRKDDFFWEAGKAVKQVGFITQGVLRVFYYNNKGEEITRYFIDENHLILSGHTGEGMYIPSEYLSAVSDCTLIVFPHRNWTELLEIIIGLDQIVQRIVARQHKEKVSRRSEMITQSAKERYLDFIHKFPTLVNRVPLSYIASYLGITQSSLSRIRKSIS